MNIPRIRTLDARLSQLTDTIRGHGIDPLFTGRDEVSDRWECERAGLDYTVVADYQSTLYQLCAAINADVNPDMEVSV